MADPTRLAQDVDRFVRRINELLHEKAAMADVEGIGQWGGMLLFLISERAPVSIHEVGQAMARDKSQITRKINELDRKRLIARTQSPSDGRVTLLTLTPLGQRRVEAFQALMGEAIETLLAPLAPVERDQLAKLLSRI